MVSQAQLEAAIRAKVDNVSNLIVSDVSGGCGQAYDVVIVSEAFEGLPTLKRHRMVNELLKDEIAQLHAFSQKTFTPKQYEQQSTPAAAPTPNMPSALSSSTLSTTGGAHHRSTSSISVPELTLTTDGDALSPSSPAGGRSGTTSGGAGSSSRPLTPGTPGGTTSPLPNDDVFSTPHIPKGISKLHFAKISSIEFWESFRAFLEAQVMGPDTPAGSASPNASGARARGEAELERLFEDFLLSQKAHLSASDVARIRDGTGMTGQGGV